MPPKAEAQPKPQPAKKANSQSRAKPKAKVKASAKAAKKPKKAGLGGPPAQKQTKASKRAAKRAAKAKAALRSQAQSESAASVPPAPPKMQKKPRCTGANLVGLVRRPDRPGVYSPRSSASQPPDFHPPFPPSFHQGFTSPRPMASPRGSNSTLGLHVHPARLGFIDEIASQIPFASTPGPSQGALPSIAANSPAFHHGHTRDLEAKQDFEAISRQAEDAEIKLRECEARFEEAREMLERWEEHTEHCWTDLTNARAARDELAAKRKRTMESLSRAKLPAGHGALIDAALQSDSLDAATASYFMGCFKAQEVASEFGLSILQTHFEELQTRVTEAPGVRKSPYSTSGSRYAD